MKAAKFMVTPLTIGSFLIVAVTGVLLFFHADVGLSRVAHEWLGWLMLATTLIHAIVVHSNSMKRYLTQRKPQLVLGASALLMVVMLIVPVEKEMKPFLKAEHALYQSELALSSQVLGFSAEELSSRLQAFGVELRQTDQSLQMVAERNGLSQREMMGILLSRN